MAFLGLDRTALWALRGLTRLFVRPTVFPEDARTRLAGTARPVLYVLEERSLSDFLAVEQACIRLGARRPSKKLVIGALRLDFSLVALERRSGVLRRRPDRRVPPGFMAAADAVRDDAEFDLEIVPVAVYWGRAPQRERSWLNLALSENWALVGPFRRLVSMLLNGRATIIRFGEPRSLRGLVAGESDAPRVVRRLLREVRAEHRHMRLETIGPNLSPRGAIVAQVLRTRAVRQAVRQLMREKSLTRREAIRTARGFALEIAADYSHAFVRLAYRALTWLWTRLYDGVDVRNAEHLDQYQNIEEIKRTFVNFANKVPFYCPIILCLDDPNLQSVIPHLERRIITYGFSAQSDIFARDFRFEQFSSTSTLHHKGRKLGTLKLNVPGMHSILNAMASVAVGLDLDIAPPLILDALESYSGTGRRFELKKEVGGIMVIEDYAHHPTEIKATLDAAKRGWPRRVLAVFQPHRYTRLSHLMNEFATSFNQADVLFITEIYAAGEEPIPQATGRALYESIKQFGHKNVHFEPDMKDLPSRLRKLARPGDIIIVLGAGNIYKIIPDLIKKLEAER